MKEPRAKGGRELTQYRGGVVAGRDEVVALRRQDASHGDAAYGHDAIGYDETAEDARDADGMRRKIMAGGIVILAVFGGMGTWAVSTSIDGAIVASGQVQVESSRKAVQHLEGGIVKDILVHDGDRVREGDLLIRLGDKAVGANLRIAQGQVAELAIRRARLIAEKEERDDFEVPANVRIGTGDGGLAAILEGQRALLRAKRQAQATEVNLLRQQQQQLRGQIAGLKEQEASKGRELTYFEDELKGLRQLFEKGLAPKGKLLALERAAETTRGAQAGIAGSIASSDMRINELELQILRLLNNGREKVAEELRTVEADMNQNSEKLVTSEDQAQRTEIRSPRSGRVYKLAVNNPGAVIRGGDVLMEIVPDDDILVISAQVNPKDVDKVQPGQSARVRLSAFNTRTTPELNGQVSLVSADMISDPATGRGFYTATVAIPPEQMARLAGLQLKPGMPAEAMILTGSRSPFSYLWKPVSDTFSRALRED